jgi:hypothetical protein
MSGILDIGPSNGQTHDDWMIDAFQKVYVKNICSDFDAWVAKLGLQMNALEEVCKNAGESCSERDVKRSVAHYHLRESIDKNLALYDYNRYPFLPNLFPVADAVAVFGTLHGKHAGFVLDFFPKVLSPCRTLAFLQSEKNAKTERVARHVFATEHYEHAESSTFGNIHNCSLDLREYRGGVLGSVQSVRGTLAFTGKPLRNTTIREFVQSCESLQAFKPNVYALAWYDFYIEFSPNDGTEKFKAGLDSLNQRAEKVFREKLECRS